MFGIYEFDNSCFICFFQSILCQMYHSLVIEIMFKIIFYKSVKNSDINLLIGRRNEIR